MTKEEWISAAADKLQPHLAENSQAYAESLYETYVEKDGDHWANDPEGALAMDMTYWND